jgi:hypothetical protein
MENTVPNCDQDSLPRRLFCMTYPVSIILLIVVPAAIVHGIYRGVVRSD